MKMLSRLRYLIAEGFEVASISGYEGLVQGNAKIMYLRMSNGRQRLCSEIFDVHSEEMQLCSNLFIAHLLKNEK